MFASLAKMNRYNKVVTANREEALQDWALAFVFFANIQKMF